MTPDGGRRYAGFWRRSTAGLVDLTLLSALILPPLLALHGADYAAWLFSDHGVFTYYSLGELLLGKLLPLALALWFWTRWGATPGKRLLGCRVIDLEGGNPPGLGQSVGRYFGYLLSALPLYLGFLWVAWDRRKQGFHDKLARTAVVYDPEDESQKSLQQLVREARA